MMTLQVSPKGNHDNERWINYRRARRFYTFQSTLPAGEYFEFRPRNPPLNSKPIVDDESGMCIGYSVAQAPGLWQIYDANGMFVRLEEAPLEAPLIDPTDLALIAFGAFRLFGQVRRYWRVVSKPP